MQIYKQLAVTHVKYLMQLVYTCDYAFITIPMSVFY
jgi:hypothetical protein